MRAEHAHALPRVLVIVIVLVIGLSPVRAEDDLRVESDTSDEPLVAHAVSLFREARSAVESRLGARLGEPPPRLLLVANEAALARRTAELGGRAPSWALAVAIPSQHVMAIRLDRLHGTTTDAFLEPTLRHELAHLVLGAVASRSRQRIPRWLDEGLAELAEGAVLTREQELELGAAARFGTLESFASLERDFPPHAPQAERAYRMCLGFAQWLDAKPGGVRALVGQIEQGKSAEESLRALTGLPAGEAEAEWKIALAEKSSIVESLLRSTGFWWGAVSVLALLAIGRYVVSSRRLKNKMARAEMLAAEPPPAEVVPEDDPPREP